MCGHSFECQTRGRPEWNYIESRNGHSWLRTCIRHPPILNHVRMASFTAEDPTRNGRMEQSPFTKEAQCSPFRSEHSILESGGESKVTPAIKKVSAVVWETDAGQLERCT